MRIDHPSPDVLRFEASRENALILAAVLFLVILIWEWIVCGRPLTPDGFRNLGGSWREQVGDGPFWMVVALPIPLLIWMLNSLVVGALGREIVFDGAQQHITKNGKVVATVAQIENIEIKRWDDGNARAKVIRVDGKKVKLGVLCRSDDLANVLGEIRTFGEVTGSLPKERPPGE